MGLMVGSSLVNNTELDFVMNQAIYEYTYEGLTQTQDNEWVYIINFAPKKRKAKYTGTLYVSVKDYAVVRADYTLGKGKTLGGVNLKFLLGVKQSENVSRGTIIFKERENEEGYYLQYASRETGSYIYINRQLKLHTINLIFDFFRLCKEQNVVDNHFAIDYNDKFNIHKVENYLANNLFNKFPGIEFLAKKFKISESKLKVEFKFFFGKSIFQYFQEKQMVVAKELIEENKVLIKELSYKFGYENTSKFTASFKKHHGILPSDCKTNNSITD